MSRKTVVLISIILVIVLASCSENPGTTSLKLNLSTRSESTGKTLLPSDSTLMDICKYSVSGEGPNGKTFSVDSDTNSLTIEGLTIGDWTVIARGKNASGTELATGTLNFRLTSSDTSQTIVLDTLVGTGNFRFSIDWSCCDVAAPAVEAFLLGPDMSGTEYPLDVTQDNSAMTATMSESLSAGSYRLRVLLKDGDTLVAGLVEAVRISNGTTTEGSHTFHFNEFGGDAITYITDATGTPIKGSLALDGSPEILVAETDYTCRFTFTEPSKVDTTGLTVEWYYDGNFMSSTSLNKEGTSLTFTPDAGVHRIDAVVYNKKLGSTGSAACSFSVEPNGQPGELSLLVEDAGSALEITPSTMVSPLPGDKFLVVTPDANKLYVCSAHTNSITVEKTYSSSELNWIGDVKKMFSDPTSNYVVFTGKFIDSKESFICMYFDSSANTVVEKIRRNKSLSSDSSIFTDLTSVAFNGNKYIYIANAGDKRDCALRIVNSEVSLIGAYNKKGTAYYAVTDNDVSPAGNQLVTTSESSASFISSTISDNGTPTSHLAAEANTAASKHIRFVNSQLVVVANNSGFTTYKSVKNGVFTKYKTFNIAAEDLEADGANYFYILDSANRVVTFEATSYEVKQVGDIELPSKAKSFALTSGYFVVVMENLKLNVYGIIQKNK